MECIIGYCVNCPWKNDEPIKHLCEESNHADVGKYCNNTRGRFEIAHPLFLNFNITLCQNCEDNLIRTIKELR